jgi:hypothetical protein
LPPCASTRARHVTTTVWAAKATMTPMYTEMVLVLLPGDTEHYLANTLISGKSVSTMSAII